MTSSASLAERAGALVVDIPDHPRAGVTFKDITPLLADGPLFGEVVADLAGRVSAVRTASTRGTEDAGAAAGTRGTDDALGRVDVVVGMEARGFILGAPVAVALGAGFVPVRKEGRLPRATLRSEYTLEYGTATLELHPDTIADGAHVLVVDDVLATGGTAAATVDLVRRAGGVVVGLAFLLEIGALGGRRVLGDLPVHALLTA